MSHRMPVGEMRRVMGQALAPWCPPGTKPPQMPPLPKRTVLKYKARVLERRAANPLPNVEEAREDAIRRVTKLIALLRAAGAVPNADKIIRAEHELAMLQGTEQPKTLQLTGPDGGALQVRATPEVIAAFDRLAAKTSTAG